MIPASADLATALAPVAHLRREQAPVRAVGALTAGVAFATVLNLPWLWAWLAAYSAAQALELWAMWPFRPGRPAPGRARAVVATASIFVLAAAFGALAPALWRVSSPVGPAAAVLLLCSGVLNVLATSRGCSSAFVAGTAPYLLLLLALPWTGRHGASPALALTFVVAVVACAATVGLIWRESRRAQQREAAALDEARGGQARALDAWSARQSFVAAVSHELRTPLTALSAASSTLEVGALTSQNRATAALISRSAELMRRLLDDLLDLAKLEAGRMEVEVAAFTPRRLVRDAADLWRGAAEAKGVRLELEDVDALPELAAGDAHRLQQLLNNLLSNAVKFTDAGEVRLACAVSPIAGGGCEAVLIVTDTGRGLTGAEVAVLFTPFAQADGAVSRTHGGTGLGLAVSRELARVMGGELVAYAGAGGRFELRLPLAPAPAEARCEPARRGFREGARLRVLLVEDNALARCAVQVLLESMGAEVVAADSGHAALDHLAVAPFDLVVMDVNMAGLDGRETCRRLRAAPGPNRAAPVLALTGETEPAQVAACLAAGMDAHLAKPVQVAALHAAVAAALVAGESRPVVALRGAA